MIIIQDTYLSALAGCPIYFSDGALVTTHCREQAAKFATPGEAVQSARRYGLTYIEPVEIEEDAKRHVLYQRQITT